MEAETPSRRWTIHLLLCHGLLIESVTVSNFEAFRILLADCRQGWADRNRTWYVLIAAHIVELLSKDASDEMNDILAQAPPLHDDQKRPVSSSN